MSLLTIVQDACKELNISVPSAVVSATDGQTKQLLSLAKKEGMDLLRRYNWQVLTKETSFTTSATEQQTTLSALGASDFYRIVDGTMYNRTRAWPVRGPVSPQEWQRRKASYAQVGPQEYFRIRGDAILFNPLPASGQTVYFEYISENWCQSSSGTAQSTWTADTDTALIDEEVIRLGVVWRWRKAKGLDYGEDFRSYEAALIDIFGPDGARASIDMGGEIIDGVSLPTVTDGSWNI